MGPTETEQKLRDAPLRIAKLIWYSRLVEMLLNLSIFIMSAFLASYINSNGYGSIGGLPAVSVLSGLGGLFGLAATWCSGHFNGYERGCCIVTFMVFDGLCIGLQIPLLIILSVMGAPYTCSGLPTLIAAENSYCNIPKAAFWESIIMLILYLWTFSLGIRLMVALSKKRKFEKGTKAPMRHGTNAETTHTDFEPTRPLRNVEPLSASTQSLDVHHDADLEATISNGSFGGSDDPPPYHADKK